MQDVDLEIQQHLDRLDKAMVRFEKRRLTFIREGLTPEEAFSLAERMYERDKDPQDDRRVCFECKHLSGSKCHGIKVAGKPTDAMRFMLQRCEAFSLKGVA